VLERHENFVEQISTKFGGFCLIKMNLIRQAHQNTGGNSYIGWYYRSVCSTDTIHVR